MRPWTRVTLIVLAIVLIAAAAWQVVLLGRYEPRPGPPSPTATAPGP